MINTQDLGKEEYDFVSSIYFKKNEFESLLNTENIVNDLTKSLLMIHKSRIVILEAINMILNYIDMYSIIEDEDNKAVFFRAFFEKNLGIIKMHVQGDEKKLGSSDEDVRFINSLATMESLKDIFLSLIIQSIEVTFKEKRENPKNVLFYVLSSNCHILSSTFASKNDKTKAVISQNMDSIKRAVETKTFTKKTIDKVDKKGINSEEFKDAMEDFLND